MEKSGIIDKLILEGNYLPRVNIYKKCSSKLTIKVIDIILVTLFLSYITTCSSVSIGEFEQINGYWNMSKKCKLFFTETISGGADVKKRKLD